MDVASVAMISLTFIGAQVAQKAASASIDSLWQRFSKAFEKEAKQPLTPQASVEAAGGVLAGNPGLLAEVEAVFGQTSALRRARLVAAALEGARILWVDDNPENNEWERLTLRQLGADVTNVESTATALGCLRSDSYDLILSDISRDGSDREGVDALSRLLGASPQIAVVFYAGRVDPSLRLPAGAFGLTNRPDELLHLILDAVERRRL